MVIISILFCLINRYDVIKTVLILVLVGYRVFEDISEAFYGILQKNNRLDIIGISMTIKVVLAIILFCIINQLTHNIILSSFGFIIGFAFVYSIYDLKKGNVYQKTN